LHCKTVGAGTHFRGAKGDDGVGSADPFPSNGVDGPVPLIVTGKGGASNIQNELPDRGNGERTEGGGGRPGVEGKVAAERLEDRSDAEHRNEGALRGTRSPGRSGAWTRKKPLEAGKHLVRVLIPILGQYQCNTPAECAEDRRLHQVTIEQVRVAVVGRRVHENAQLVFPLGRASHGEIASKPGLTDITVHCIAACCKRPREGRHDGVAGIDRGERLSREWIQFLENSPCLGSISV
jgi:hypothetical protein